jgi:hypothetical protein
MRAHDRDTVIRLRHQLQACESCQWLALVTATELKERFGHMAVLIPIKEMAETNVVLQLTERLVALLSGSGEGGGR